MKYYELKVLCATPESKAWNRLHEEDDEVTPRDLLVTRPLMLNVDSIESFFPDKDKRCVELNCLGSSGSYIIAKTFEAFKQMVIDNDYVEV